GAEERHDDRFVVGGEVGAGENVKRAVAADDDQIGDVEGVGEIEVAGGGPAAAQGKRTDRPAAAGECLEGDGPGVIDDVEGEVTVADRCGEVGHADEVIARGDGGDDGRIAVDGGGADVVVAEEGSAGPGVVQSENGID